MEKEQESLAALTYGTFAYEQGVALVEKVESDLRESMNQWEELHK